jgi:hypothetical protein
MVPIPDGEHQFNAPLPIADISIRRQEPEPVRLRLGIDAIEEAIIAFIEARSVGRSTRNGLPSKRSFDRSQAHAVSGAEPPRGDPGSVLHAEAMFLSIGKGSGGHGLRVSHGLRRPGDQI